MNSWTLPVEPVLAHPGHGSVSADSPVHYVVEPVHSIWLVFALAIGGTALLVVRRQMQRRKSRAESSVRRPAADRFQR